MNDEVFEEIAPMTALPVFDSYVPSQRVKSSISTGMRPDNPDDWQVIGPAPRYDPFNVIGPKTAAMATSEREVDDYVQNIIETETRRIEALCVTAWALQDPGHRWRLQRIMQYGYPTTVASTIEAS